MAKFKNLQRLFIQEKITEGNLIELENNQIHYLTRVIRKKHSDKLIIFNPDDGEFLSHIIFQGKKIFIEPLQKIEKNEKNLGIKLYAPLIKQDKFAILIDMATQIGVTEIIPIWSEFCQKSEINHDRILKIVQESSEQSGRIFIPKIHPIAKFKDLFSQNNFDNDKNFSKLIIWACERDLKVPNILNNNDIYQKIKNTDEISILIGPEGGFSDGEKNLLTQLDFVQPVTLSDNILRSETASISLMTIITLIRN